MTHDAKNDSEIRSIDLKNRWLAAALAWLFPGLGHLYQGRVFKGILFALCLGPLIIGGVWMGTYQEQSSEETPGTWRVATCAYCSFPKESGMKSATGWFSTLLNGRLYFIPQAANATIAIPALIQSRRVARQQPLYWDGAFAPPRTIGEKNISLVHQPTLNEILLAIHSWFDLGTIFLAVAGLLNLLVLFDAFAGPAWSEPPQNKT